MATETAPSPPLSPAVFAILLALAGGEKHGYAIRKEARTAEGGGVAMGPGTLYGTLDRLMRDGLVAESGMSDDERRRYYKLTGLGQTALAAEVGRLRAAVQSPQAQGVLAEGGRS